MWNAYKAHFGKDGDPILVWKASTRTMNPELSQEEIDKEYDAAQAKRFDAIEKMQKTVAPAWQTLTTSGTSNYQPTLVGAASAMNFSAASLTNRNG